MASMERVITGRIAARATSWNRSRPRNCWCGRCPAMWHVRPKTNAGLARYRMDGTFRSLGCNTRCPRCHAYGRSPRMAESLAAIVVRSHGPTACARLPAAATGGGFSECNAAGLPVETVVRCLFVVIQVGGPVHERSR